MRKRRFSFLRKVTFLVFILVVVLVLVFSFFKGNSTGESLRNFFYNTSYSLQDKFSKIGEGSSDFFGRILASRRLQEDNEALKKENQRLLSELVFLKSFEGENVFLRKALELELEREFDLTLADVISYDVTSDSLVINKGGLKVGLPVISEEKVLIGKISETFNDFSRVLLLSNKENSFPVEIQDRSVTAIVKGRGNLLLGLEEIPVDKDVSKGDFVVSTSLGGDFPEGLLIGRLENITRSNTEPVQTADVKTSLNIKKLRNVFVITNL